MKCKVAELSGQQLDDAVAYVHGRVLAGEDRERYKPSTNWAHGGPLIEQNEVTISGDSGDWTAWTPVIEFGCEDAINMNGPTMLIAAMRSFVAARLGWEIDLPDESERARLVAEQIRG